jgi:hypothetical protein
MEQGVPRESTVAQPFKTSPAFCRICTLIIVFTRALFWVRLIQSTPAQTLWSWVRNPLEEWMSVCFYSMFVLSCVQVAALWRADPLSKEPYRPCNGLRNWKGSRSPTKGCTVTDEWISTDTTYDRIGLMNVKLFVEIRHEGTWRNHDCVISWITDFRASVRFHVPYFYPVYSHLSRDNMF